MGFSSYCLSLSLYIMSSCLRRYSVLMNSIHQMHAGQRSMCGVIVVDAGRSRSTNPRCDAYIHDHCLGYHHDYFLFYQFPNSNLSTHRMLFSREKPLVKPMAPGVYLSQITKTLKILLPYLFMYFILCFCFNLTIYHIQFNLAILPPRD